MASARRQLGAIEANAAAPRSENEFFTKIFFSVDEADDGLA
jgi:hypothetical protein